MPEEIGLSLEDEQDLDAAWERLEEDESLDVEDTASESEDVLIEMKPLRKQMVKPGFLSSKAMQEKKDKRGHRYCIDDGKRVKCPPRQDAEGDQPAKKKPKKEEVAETPKGKQEEEVKPEERTDEKKPSEEKPSDAGVAKPKQAAKKTAKPRVTKPKVAAQSVKDTVQWALDNIGTPHVGYGEIDKIMQYVESLPGKDVVALAQSYNALGAKKGKNGAVSAIRDLLRTHKRVIDSMQFDEVDRGAYYTRKPEGKPPLDIGGVYRGEVPDAVKEAIKASEPTKQAYTRARENIASLSDSDIDALGAEFSKHDPTGLWVAHHDLLGYLPRQPSRHEGVRSLVDSLKKAKAATAAVTAAAGKPAEAAKAISAIPDVATAYTVARNSARTGPPPTSPEQAQEIVRTQAPALKAAWNAAKKVAGLPQAALRAIGSALQTVGSGTVKGTADLLKQFTTPEGMIINFSLGGTPALFALGSALAGGVLYGVGGITEYLGKIGHSEEESGNNFEDESDQPEEEGKSLGYRRKAVEDDPEEFQRIMGAMQDHAQAMFVRLLEEEMKKQGYDTSLPEEEPEPEPEPVIEMKSLNKQMVKPGFLSSKAMQEKKDKRGHRYCIDEGKRVKCPPRQGAGEGKSSRKKPAAKKPAAPKPAAVAPEDVVRQTRAAMDDADREAFDRISHTVKKASGSRGGLGVAGLRTIAGQLGLKTTGLKKAQLAQSIVDHLVDAKKLANVRNLQTRLDRIRLAEQGTGINFRDRIINSMLGFTHANDERFKEAYSDIAHNGENAKASNVSYMRAIRKNMLDKINGGKYGEPQMQVILNSLAEEGYGRLHPNEVADFLGGSLTPQAVEQKIRDENGGIIPDDLQLVPARKRKKPGQPKAPEDYIDRLRQPREQRMGGVRQYEKATGRPFVADVLTRIVRDGKVDLPGSKEYLELASKVVESGRQPSAEESKKLASFRESFFRQLKLGNVNDEAIVRALEDVDESSNGTATMHLDEFKESVRKINPATQRDRY